MKMISCIASKHGSGEVATEKRFEDTIPKLTY